MQILIAPSRGSIGGVTTQGGRFGTIQRQRSIPSNPQTVAQQNQRSILASVASEWRGLSEAQRGGWEALAQQITVPVLGGVAHLTGFNMYVRINATRVTCGQAKLEDAPLIPAFGIMTTSGLVVTAVPAMKLSLVADTVAPDKFMIEATAPSSQGRASGVGGYRLISVVAGHSVAADIDIVAAYGTKFGAIVAGQAISVRISAVKSGFKGVPLQYRGVVGA